MWDIIIQIIGKRWIGSFNKTLKQFSFLTCINVSKCSDIFLNKCLRYSHTRLQRNLLGIITLFNCVPYILLCWLENLWPNPQYVRDFLRIIPSVLNQIGNRVFCGLPRTGYKHIKICLMVCCKHTNITVVNFIVFTCQTMEIILVLLCSDKIVDFQIVFRRF